MLKKYVFIMSMAASLLITSLSYLADGKPNIIYWIGGQGAHVYYVWGIWFLSLWSYISWRTPEGSPNEVVTEPSETGKRLKLERERLGYSIQEFAKLCDVSSASQFIYERGTHKPPKKYIEMAERIGLLRENL